MSGSGRTVRNDNASDITRFKRRRFTHRRPSRPNNDIRNLRARILAEARVIERVRSKTLSEITTSNGLELSSALLVDDNGSELGVVYPMRDHYRLRRLLVELASYMANITGESVSPKPRLHSDSDTNLLARYSDNAAESILEMTDQELGSHHRPGVTEKL